MDTFFGPDFFTTNRTKLHTVVGTDTIIVLTGNGQMQKSADEPYKFNQDSNFWYVTGLNAPDLTVVMTPKDTYLIVPVLSFERAAFEGAHNIEAYAARSGITTIMTEREGWRRLRQDVAGATTVATPGALPSYIKRHGLHALPYRRRLIAKIKRLNPSVTIQDIRPVFTDLRAVKQPEELRAIQKAIDITTETLNDVVKKQILGAATNEFQLEAALSYGFRMRGASGHAFTPIVGAGADSTTLHHFENNSPIAASDVIVLDVGAEYEHYASDIARTVSQQPITGRAAAIFKAVLAVQEYALGLIKPGVLPTEYEKEVERYMGEQLRSLGIITSDKHEDIRQYFPHATSHFLGLDTHDAGDYRKPFQENMVITCEPGIYLPDEHIGVRIEDDVLITADGTRVLSAACPRVLTPVQ